MVIKKIIIIPQHLICIFFFSDGHLKQTSLLNMDTLICISLVLKDFGKVYIIQHLGIPDCVQDFSFSVTFLPQKCVKQRLDLLWTFEEGIRTYVKKKNKLLLEHSSFVRSGLLDWPVHKYNVILKLRTLLWSNWSTFQDSLATSSYSSICLTEKSHSICGLADGACNQIWLMVSASCLCLEFSQV